MRTESKQHAFDLFEEHRADYLAQARKAAKEIWDRTGKPVNVNQVREVCPPPEHVNGQVMGAIFNRGDWEFVRYIKSDRNDAHRRPIAEFRYREKSVG